MVIEKAVTVGATSQNNAVASSSWLSASAVPEAASFNLRKKVCDLSLVALTLSVIEAI